MPDGGETALSLAGTTRSALRARYEDFVERHDVAWELVFAVLAIGYVVLGSGDDGASPIADTLEWMITILFAAEFATRLWAARSRRRYVLDHWIDAVALVPPTRGLRALRLLRLLRLVRAFAGVARIVGDLKRLAKHRGLIWLLAGWVGVVTLTSLGMYVAEHGVNPALLTGWDALWWGVVTMTGTGGEVIPTTNEGRAVAAILMVLGVTLFSAVTAVATSFLVRDEGMMPMEDPIERIRRLAELRDEGHITRDEFERARKRLLGRL